MIARFHENGVNLELEPLEYSFFYLLLGHVLYGIPPSDNDFRNFFGMAREDAEALLDRLRAFEGEARAEGRHWNTGPLPEV